MAIAQVASVCKEGQVVIDKTLVAVDDAVFGLNPVSDYRLILPQINVS